MDFKQNEKKWQKYWREHKIFEFDENNLKDKYYLLEMFSYPSGSNLHLGHWFNYALSDSFGRFKTMQGKNVFHPMGFDAFGLPAENYALKTGIHPETSTLNNMQKMEQQLTDIGATYDWRYEIKTCMPDYYKWTQWLFVKLMKAGLAEQKHAPVNYCPSCQTVLANEQVVDGKCERCESEVVKKHMTQWFLKTTAYAEQLLSDLPKLDWPEKTKIAQTNWIGKSVGAEIDFKLENGENLTVFTSRPDTAFGVTYVVLAPEHKLVEVLTTDAQKDAVSKYVYEASKKDDITRQSTSGEKTGVFTGSYCINPLNNKKVPVFIADYVLSTYATGAVMGVAAHDERDFEFAKKIGLDIVKVINNPKGETTLPYTNEGILCNSQEFDGLTSKEAKAKIVERLEKLGAGRQKVNYKLRDWSVSRQRYWGCPIPVIHCEHCGAVPVPEKDLPVELPKTMEYKSKAGSSPLSRNEKYMNVVCPICGLPAKRDPDTLDTFVCSSWYYLRYPNANNCEKPFDSELTNKILPVDTYVGGMEHACSHLLYSRFITKFLHDQGYIDFDEPFKRLIHQGMILGEDGQKMSKSKGNIVNPDEYLSEYGTDALRLYLMFGFNFTDGGPWNVSGIKNMHKFMERVERVIIKVLETKNDYEQMEEAENELEYVRHNSIKNATQNMQNFEFNSVIARIMELVNGLSKYLQSEKINFKLAYNVAKDLIKLLAPCAPHFAEELWHLTGENKSVFKSTYPVFDESKIIKNQVEYALQINSKIVARANFASNLQNTELEEKAKAYLGEKLNGKEIIKTIIIQSRLINFIVK